MKDIILLVEDAHFMTSLMQKRLQKEFSFEVRCAENMSDALDIVNEVGDRIFLSLLDLTLPDAPDGEIVDAMLSLKIPSIVFSGYLEQHIRETMLSKNIIDYVGKDGTVSLDYLIALIRRLQANQHITALIVDDSATSRKYLSKMLSRMMIRFIAVNNAEQALLAIADAEEDFRLMLVDFNMPETNGLELVRAIRKQTNINHTAIIGVSELKDHFLTAQFLKAGASDFIYKSQSSEEFLCRISQALDRLDHVEQLENAASTDFLTQLHNRRALFDTGNVLWSQACRETFPKLGIAMLDIDYFKRINDQYGHEAGDGVLCGIARLLQESFRQSDLVVRYGGEEFCVLVQGCEPDRMRSLLEDFCQKLALYRFNVEGESLTVSVSIGICCDLHDSLQAMIDRADQRLYAAKEKGRNCIVSVS